jgi:hypothetical protein
MSYAVDSRTRKITGELTRFDERNTVLARERLVPGSPQEQAHHAARPIPSRCLPGLIRSSAAAQPLPSQIGHLHDLTGSLLSVRAIGRRRVCVSKTPPVRTREK